MFKFLTKIRDWINSRDEVQDKIKEHGLLQIHEYMKSFTPEEQEYIIHYNDYSYIKDPMLENLVNILEKSNPQITAQEKAKYRINLFTSALRYHVMLGELDIELMEYEDSKKWIHIAS